MAEAIGGGVDATVGRGALQVVIAVEFRFRAVPIVPLLVTVGARCVAGKGVAAGVAGVVAVRLQQEQELRTGRGRALNTKKESQEWPSGVCLTSKLKLVKIK